MRIEMDIEPNQLVIILPHDQAVMIVDDVLNNLQVAEALQVVEIQARLMHHEWLRAHTTSLTPTPAPDAHLEAAYEEMTEQEQEDFDHGFNDHDDDPEPYQGTYSED